MLTWCPVPYPQATSTPAMGNGKVGGDYTRVVLWMSNQQLIPHSERLKSFSAAIWNPLETHMFGRDTFYSG